MSDAGDQSKVKTLTKNSANRDKRSNEVILPSDQNNAEALLVNEIVAENSIIQDSSEALAKTKSEGVPITNENNGNTVQLDDISALALTATPAEVSVT